jgi:2',5'-phosphodiesterase
MQYNVLSSHLASPDYFTSCKPSYLDASYRFESLCKKLDRETSSNSIICLQEISMEWAGLLYPYFSQRNYQLVTGLYGGKFNGYMGVAIAVPQDRYDLVSTNIKRIADTKFIPKAPLLTIIQKLMRFFLDLIGIRPVQSPWATATAIFNQMVTVELKCKESEEQFLVGCYHMPCKFRMPEVMTIHASLATQHLQKLARGRPYIFAGDFNIKPDSNTYKLLTEGTIESNESTKSDIPPTLDGDSWRMDVAPLRSAYKIAMGSEPDFTNYARIRDDPVFIDTLDYIFLSPQWLVDSVDELPHRSAVQEYGPLPTENEPSDHLPLYVNLSIKKDVEVCG